MRNLQNVFLEEELLPQGTRVTAVAWDGDSIVYAFGPTADRPVIELKRKNKHEEDLRLITAWDAPCPLPDLACDEIVLLQHFSDNVTSCLVLAGGDVVVVREDPQPGQDKIEIVGSVDVGIIAAAWAPDEELLAIVTRADTLILMSRDFEPITDVTLSADDLKASKHVSVGWGKRETQFQGKRAKALRDPTVPETVDEGKLSPTDDGKCTVSWRGDGAFLAINSVVSGRRVIRVFTREAVLDSASEPVNGLESALSWKPSGNLIASVQRLEDRVDVVFFERNGLRHGQFSLRLSNVDGEKWASAIALCWNIDSTVLAVSFQDRVQLWTMGNYHYYLKQEVISERKVGSVTPIAFKWHLEEPLRCALLSAVSILDMEFAFSVTRGSTIPPHDHGIVAVVDGKSLKITLFKYATIPPPMSFCDIAVKDNILDCAICPSGRSMVILTTKSLEVFEWDLEPKPSTLLRRVKTLPLSAGDGTSVKSQYFCALYPDGQPWTNYSSLVDSKVGLEHPETNIYSISKRGELLTGQRVLARNCTSFLVTDKHLVFTTSQHFLKFIELADLQVPADSTDVDDRCRNIERGARLVTVIPSKYQVVLQMPRGNLETICPRILVLAGVRQHIDEKDWKAAFLACRVHQVDMSVIHDYRPDLFFEEIPNFIGQVKKISWIDDFLSKIREENVQATRGALENGLMHSESPQGAASPHPSEKVNRICDAFLSALNLSTNLQNLVTAHVCKHPPDVTAGLVLVADMRKKDTARAEAAVEHLCFLTDANRLFDAALSLYDLELALLVSQQSQKDPREYMPFLQSLHALPPHRRRFQIDDYLRNYKKALISLHELSVHEELDSYTIKHNLYPQAVALYEYDQPRQSAITVLYASYLHSQFRHADAALAYQSVGDFESAYPLYALAHNWRKCLFCAMNVPLPAEQVQSLARSLATTCAEEDRDYRSAATIHSDFLSDVPGAARLLCKGSHFVEAGYLLALHGLTDSVTEILGAGLSEKSSEVTELLADCKAQLGKQVPRIKQLRLKKEQDPLAFFGGDAMAVAAADGGVDIPDNVSLAPTDASTAGGQSLFTRYGSKFGGTVASNVSRKTSKTRRREERKRARGKEGSVYEEDYLINSVRRLIERVGDEYKGIRALIEMLLARGLRQRAAVLDEAVREVIQLCKKAKEEVWSFSGAEGVQKVAGAGAEADAEERPPGADGVFWESQMGSSMGKPPRVMEWQGTCLLGGD